MAETQITIQRDMEFGVHDGDSLTGDLYSPEGSGNYPAIVALHGGGWKLGSSQSYQYWGPYLAERGYALFSVNYRLLQGAKNRYPASVHDARAAVQFLKSRSEELRVDPDRIGLMGDSAGAHLSAITALAGDTPLFADAYSDDPYAGVSTSVKTVVGIYGVYDMLAQWEHDQVSRPLDQITQSLLGKSPMESKWLFYEASPTSYTTVDNNHTAFLIVWGDEDDIVDRHSQSEAFVNSLKQAGFFTRSVIVPGAPHFWMSDPLDEPRSHPAFLAPRLLRFLQDRL
jgi:acetyl esterase/lipase